MECTNPVTESTTFMSVLPRGRPCRKLACGVVLCLIASLSQATTADWGDAREAAVVLARQGHTEQALQQLSELLTDHPYESAIRFDYAVVAGWHGDDELAVAAMADQTPDGLPDYVLAAYARSARNAGRFDLAVDLYAALAERESYRLRGLVGGVLAMADAGRLDEGLVLLEAVDEKPAFESSEFADLQFACGYLFERARNYMRALDCYNLGLRHHPEHGELRRRRAMVASAMGAADVAGEEVARDPALFAASERAGIRMDEAAMKLRWSGLSRETEDLAGEDRALAQYDELTAEIDPGNRTLQFDRFIALTVANRMNEAEQAFQRILRAHGPADQLPRYVLAGAGRMYLYLEEPDEAVRYYQLTLVDADELPPGVRFPAQMGLFSALADAGAYEEMLDLVQILEAQEAPWIRPSPKIWRVNPRFTSSVEAAAVAQAYVDQHDQALARLDELLSVAPANGSLRLTRAAVLRWRGWYAKSAADLEKVSATGEYQLRTAVDTAHLALETRDYPGAEAALDEARRLHARDKSVVDLVKRWRLHNRPELYLRASSGRSDGGRLGSRSLDLESYYYSAPLSTNYRAFLHGLSRYAEFEEGDGRDARLGAGVEYRKSRLTWRGEVFTGLDQWQGTGAEVSAGWRLSDYWQLGVSAALNGPGVPLRGLRVGIDGEDMQLRLTRRWHEARRADLALGVMRLDDDNQRRWASLSFQQRVFNAPRHKLDAVAGFYSSDNKQLNSIYFNPTRDREMTVGLRHEWRLLRDYDRWFFQRIGITAGSYFQESYGSDPLWRLNWEQEWQISPALSITYGASLGKRSYDGDRERQTSFFLTLGSRL